MFMYTSVVGQWSLESYMFIQLQPAMRRKRLAQSAASHYNERCVVDYKFERTADHCDIFTKSILFNYYRSSYVPQCTSTKIRIKILTYLIINMHIRVWLYMWIIKNYRTHCTYAYVNGLVKWHVLATHLHWIPLISACVRTHEIKHVSAVEWSLEQSAA
jgi:hypothetical protein